MNQFQVKENPTKVGLGQALGISEERAGVLITALAKVTADAVRNGASISNVLQEATGLAENANEAAFISFSIGAYFESQKDPLSGLLKMFASSTKKTN